MMIKISKTYKISFLFLLFLFCACNNVRSSKIEEKDIPLGDTKENTVIDNSQLKYSSYSTRVKGLSGICYNKDKTGFLAVSDKGRIFELDFEGNKIKKLAYRNRSDFEGITINPETGEIYLADEARNTIYKLNSEDSDSSTEVVSLEMKKLNLNRQIEGVSYGNDTLYIVNQKKPTLLIKYSIKNKTETRIKLKFAGYLSDICYDYSDNTLWVVDSKKRMATQCNLSGEVIRQINIEMVKKAEAILVDKKENLMWVGCDLTGRLFKIELDSK